MLVRLSSFSAEDVFTLRARAGRFRDDCRGDHDGPTFSLNHNVFLILYTNARALVLNLPEKELIC